MGGTFKKLITGNYFEKRRLELEIITGFGWLTSLLVATEPRHQNQVESF